MATWNNDRVRDLVIRTLLGESNGTPEGMVSVAHVMKNRADSGAWGDRTVSGLTRTITAPKQFSMWNTDDPKLRALAAGVNAIPTSDPRYQRAAAIADGVFGGQIADPTNGATHYHTPSVHPDWSNGVTPSATIGGHYFYKLPLGAGNTAGTAVTGPSSVGTGSAPDSAAAPVSSAGRFGPNDVYRNIPVRGEHGEDQIPMFLRWNPDPIGNDQKNFAGLNPNIQRIIAQARTDNPNLSFVIGNGKRSAEDQDWAKSVGWSKAGSKDGGDALTHMNGNAVDLWGLDKDGRVQMDPAQQAQINQAMKAAAQKLGVPITWGGDWKGFKDAPHFEVQDGGLTAAGAEPPKYVAPLLPKSAIPMGEGGGPTPYGIVKEDLPTVPAGHGGIGSDSRIPLGTAPAGTPPAVSTIVPNPADVPAANAQPVSATAPTTNPSAGFVGPGNDKYSVIQRMATGVSHNPEFITAANWGNLFGGAGTPSVAPPSATPAAPAPPAAPSGKPAVSAPVTSTPIDTNHPLPWQAPQQGPPQPTPWEKATTDRNNPLPWPAAGPGHTPNWGPWHAGGSPTGPVIDAAPSAVLPPTVIPNRGANFPNTPDTLPNTGGVPGGGVTGRAPMTEGAPSMGFPAQTNPFGAQLPGSMLSSAQNLIKLLFPSAIG